MRWIGWRAALAVILALALSAPPGDGPMPTAHAASTVTVNSTADEPDASPGDGVCASTPSGVCTLRAAIMEANALAGADTITLPAGTYALSRATATQTDTPADGDLDITSDVTIRGASSGATLIISDNRVFIPSRLLEISSAGSADISGVSFRGGHEYAGDGGAINNRGSLTLRDSEIRENYAIANGGGIASSGTLTLRNVALTKNLANDNSGGGLSNVGVATLIDVTVEENSAVGTGYIYGGGIVNQGSLTATRLVVRRNSAGTSRGVGWGGGLINGGQVTLTDSVVDGNVAAGSFNRDSFTGGIYNRASLSLNRVLVSNNDRGGIISVSGTVNAANLTVAGNPGGGILTSGGSVSLSNATITDTTAAAGTYAFSALGGTARFKNTLVSRADGNTCAGAVTSLGNNMDSGDRCAFHAAGDQTNVDPKLGPLANNGGFSLTHALLAGSPAIDRGADAFCQVTDQRGSPRPRDGNGDGSAVCDIGAFELQPVPASVRCTPRPPVRGAVARNGLGALLATLTATTPPDSGTNRLRTLRFGQVTNATVDAGGQTGLGSNQAVTLPEGLSQTTVVVHRGPNGSSATVELVVVDDCGEWQTLLGGGSDAWGGGAASTSNPSERAPAQAGPPSPTLRAIAR
jgi:CSLREA domain-containing protein